MHLAIALRRAIVAHDRTVAFMTCHSLATQLVLAHQRGRWEECLAMLDRILHRCHVVNIRGGSCRMRQYRGMHGLPEDEKSVGAGEDSSSMHQSPPPPVS